MVTLMETGHLTKLEKRVSRLEHDIKRMKEFLEMASPIDPLNWLNKGGGPEFSELDRTIIQLLIAQERSMSTTEIAEAIGLENVNSGRVIVWRRLKQIQKRSKERQVEPIVVSENRKWSMNFDGFTFIKPKGENE